MPILNKRVARFGNTDITLMDILKWSQDGTLMNSMMVAKNLYVSWKNGVFKAENWVSLTKTMTRPVQIIFYEMVRVNGIGIPDMSNNEGIVDWFISTTMKKLMSAHQKLDTERKTTDDSEISKTLKMAIQTARMK